MEWRRITAPPVGGRQYQSEAVTPDYSRSFLTVRDVEAGYGWREVGETGWTGGFATEAEARAAAERHAADVTR